MRKISLLVLALATLGCGDNLPPACAPRAGRGYLATYRGSDAGICTGQSWTSYYRDGSDACEVTTSGAGWTMTVAWDPGSDSASGELVIAPPSTEAPGPCPGKYTVTVLPYVPHAP